MSQKLVKSLFRSLLRHSRQIEKTPFHKCFLIAKPSKIYSRDIENTINVHMTTEEFEIVENVINKINNGEYYCPSIDNINSNEKSLTHLLKKNFRNGISQEYISQLNISNNETLLLNKSLQLGFYLLKRLSQTTYVINSISNMPKSPKASQMLHYNNEWKIHENSHLSMINANNHNNDEHKMMDISKKIPLKQPFSLNSLQLINKNTSSNDNNNFEIKKGMILISHPISCISSPTLHRKVIYLIEVSQERVIGITLNNTIDMFQFQFPKFDEHHYIGGPVGHQYFPFYLLHNSRLLYRKFKRCSSILVQFNNQHNINNINNEHNVYWTWVSHENANEIYRTFRKIKFLNSSNKIRSKINNNNKKKENEHQKKMSQNNETSNQIENENNIVQVEHKMDKLKINDEIKMINCDNNNKNNNNNKPIFKLFRRYTSWDYDQLKLEIENNVWFPAQLNDKLETQQLLLLKCPIYNPKNNTSSNDNKNILSATAMNRHYCQTFNDGLWQQFLCSLKNEYPCLSLFPEFTKETSQIYHQYLNELQHCWNQDDFNINDDDDDEDVDDIGIVIDIDIDDGPNNVLDYNQSPILHYEKNDMIEGRFNQLQNDNKYDNNVDTATVGTNMDPNSVTKNTKNNNRDVNDQDLTHTL